MCCGWLQKHSLLTIQEVGSALTAMGVNQVFIQAQNQDKMVFNLGDRAHVKKFWVACCSMIEIGPNESTDTKNSRLVGVKSVLDNCWFAHYMVMPHRDEMLIPSLKNQMMIESRSIPPKTSNYHANQFKLDSDCTKAGHNPIQTVIKDSKFHSYEETNVVSKGKSANMVEDYHDDRKARSRSCQRTLQPSYNKMNPTRAATNNNVECR